MVVVALEALQLVDWRMMVGDARLESRPSNTFRFPVRPIRHEPLALPLQDVDWDDLDEILKHLPETERRNALQM